MEGGRLESRLEAERERTNAVIRDLNQELADIAEATAAGTDDEHDAEGSTVAYERARVKALLARAEHAAREIEAAAARTHGDSAVRCADCDLVIPLERLLALPTTRTCVSCAGRL